MGRYRIKGLRGLDSVSPNQGCAWYQLSYGNLVVAVNGEEEWGTWVHLIDEAEALYQEERVKLRALPL